MLVTTLNNAILFEMSPQEQMQLQQAQTQQEVPQERQVQQGIPPEQQQQQQQEEAVPEGGEASQEEVPQEPDNTSQKDAIKRYAFINKMKTLEDRIQQAGYSFEDLHTLLQFSNEMNFDLFKNLSEKIIDNIQKEIKNINFKEKKD